MSPKGEVASLVEGSPCHCGLAAGADLVKDNIVVAIWVHAGSH